MLEEVQETSRGEGAADSCKLVEVPGDHLSASFPLLWTGHPQSISEGRQAEAESRDYESEVSRDHGEFQSCELIPLSVAEFAGWQILDLDVCDTCMSSSV